ncbi:hypothetical protein LTR08_003734 [Meristemomyces frigidus]|nr:hypothetical protein LTR08_003734 [Meristemomyces frigidus]
MMVFALIDAATPTWGPMNVQLGFSYAILNDSYAIGCATLAFGAAMLIPFALKYGRRPIYIFSTAAQFAISIWSARINTVADIMLVNVFSCWVGSLAEVIVQMTIADVYFTHERGRMNSIFVWVENPVTLLSIKDGGGHGGGAQYSSALRSSYTSLRTRRRSSTMPEPHQRRPSEILDGLRTHTSAKTAEQMAEKTADKPGQPDEIVVSSRTSDSELGSEAQDDIRRLSVIHVDPSIPRKTYRQRLSIMTPSEGSFGTFFRHTYQPFMILFTIPAVGYMSMVYGVMLAWSTVMTVTLSSWMLGPPWNFSAAQIGLMSLPPFIGTTIGSLICGPLSDWFILYVARRNHGIFEPEMRLWVMVPFVLFLPLGAFVFGYGLNNGWSWPVIAIAYAISNFGSAPISSIALTYITDSYTEIVGDSLVGVTFTRNLLSTIFVFALSPWIASVGMANVYVTIGVIGIAVLSFVFVFIWKGKQFRRNSAKRYRWYAERQYGARSI